MLSLPDAGYHLSEGSFCARFSVRLALLSHCNNLTKTLLLLIFSTPTVSAPPEADPEWGLQYKSFIWEGNQ